MSRTARDSGFSDKGNSPDRFAHVTKTPRYQTNDLYAAVRPLIGTYGSGGIEFVRTTKIIDFDKDKQIPYDARIETGVDPDSDEIIIENFVVCGLGSFDQLVCNTKRFPKPSKRRSQVAHELAKEALQKAGATSHVAEQKKKKSNEENGKSTKHLTVSSGSMLPLPTFDDLKAKTMSSNIVVVDVLDFEVGETATNKAPPPESNGKDKSSHGGVMDDIDFQFDETTPNRSTPYELDEKDVRIMFLEKQLEELKRNIANLEKPSTSSSTDSFIESPKTVRPSESSAASLGILETPRSRHGTKSLDRGRQLLTTKSPIKTSSFQAKKSTAQNKSAYVRRTKELTYNQDDFERDCHKYPELQKRENFKSFKTNEINETTGKTYRSKHFYLCFGITVPFRDWEEAVDLRSPSLFLRRLSSYIWDQSLFVLLAVNIDKVANPLERISVKETPRQFMALKPVPKNKRETIARDKKLRKFGREMGIIIDQARRSYYAKSNIETDQAGDELRSDSENREDERNNILDEESVIGSDGDPSFEEFNE